MATVESAHKVHERDFKNYITHLIYLKEPDTPNVQTEELKSLGIECVRVYGRRADSGAGVRYDAKALGQALEAILGRKNGRKDAVRRMTVDQY
jgi:hypothetical protein